MALTPEKPKPKSGVTPGTNIGPQGGYNVNPVPQTGQGAYSQQTTDPEILAQEEAANEAAAAGGLSYIDPEMNNILPYMDAQAQAALKATRELARKQDVETGTYDFMSRYGLDNNPEFNTAGEQDIFSGFQRRTADAYSDKATASLNAGQPVEMTGEAWNPFSRVNAKQRGLNLESGGVGSYGYGDGVNAPIDQGTIDTKNPNQSYWMGKSKQKAREMGGQALFTGA
jgi:hypothetical protein